MSSHPEWYTALAPTCHKYFLFPPYTREDFGNDMGDSVITETAGWGAFLSGNSLALAHNVGITVDEAFEGQKFNLGRSRESFEFYYDSDDDFCCSIIDYCVSRNEKLSIPSFGYAKAPLGLDLRQVIKRGRPFLINTGTLLLTETVLVIAVHKNYVTKL